MENNNNDDNNIQNDINENGNNSILVVKENKDNQENFDIKDNNSQNGDEGRTSRNINIADDESEQNINTESRMNDNKRSTLRHDNITENNISARIIIDNALFSQLSEIKVYLLDFEENAALKIYNAQGKILPKIDNVEFKLLDQNTSISKLKQYGFGLYVFFLYLINLLVTFGILFIFAFHYMYRIFYRYFRDYEEEYSLLFDYNILSLVSGVQIIKFRKYYIEVYGKDAFLENYKDFDVIYKEYLFTGTLVFIIAFLFNFIFSIYLQRVYKLYRIENPEIKNYTLILSGDEVPFIDKTKIRNEEIISINDERTAKKNEILKLLDVKDADINFTFKLSEYYQKMDKFNKKRNKKYKLQYKINRNKCCCHGCCCFCGCCFCCCCSKSRLIAREKEIENKMENLKDEMIEIKRKEIYNPLHIITFKNIEDYNRVYSEYPHSYIKNSIRNLCRKKKIEIYANKAPSPEDIVWRNLEFDKKYRYFKSKFKTLVISLLYVIVSFIIQIIGEFFDQIANSLMMNIINIIVSFLLDKLAGKFSEKIFELLRENSNSWSYSDIKFYSILFQSIFKLISQGVFPLVTYLIFAEKDDNYFNLVSKMFVIIEMDGFGYPMIDWLYGVVLTKGRDMYDTTQKMMSIDNIEKEISDNVVNAEGLSRLELEQAYEKKEMDLEENYSDTLAIYWITMFYLSIYPVGLIQSFLNLLFKYIIEKNFLLNVYKRPEYINPQFGFLCFNFFNFGFFLFLCGNIIFFYNEDNKKSFGAAYIVIMILILIIPFYLLAKLINYLTNYCCLKKEESKNFDDIKDKLRSDYRLFNPYYQKEKIEELFLEYKNKNLLTISQYEEIQDKINRLNDLDLYILQQKLRSQKIMKFEKRKLTTNFIYEHDSKEVVDEREEQLYSMLMQTGFISYLEEGNILKPRKHRIEFYVDPKKEIRSIALTQLNMHENLSNSDSGYFTIFNDKDELIMAYVDGERNVKIFDVFHKKIISNVKGLNHTGKIVCVDYYKSETQNGLVNYLITIALDNKMIISDITTNEKITTQIIEKVGESFEENKPNNTFSLSTVRHEKSIWIITSYYHDKSFKIFNLIGELIYTVPVIPDNINENIISLEGLFYTEENTYICVRTSSSIFLYINQFFIKQIRDNTNDSYINFKIVSSENEIIESKYIIISIIKKDLSSYGIQMINIAPIFPLFTRIFNFLVKVTFGQNINTDVHIPMNAEIQKKIINNNPIDVLNYQIPLIATGEQVNTMRKFYESNDDDKFNIGNILFWGKGYIIVGTPFSYLDIIDFSKGQKVGVINITDSIKNDENKEMSDIRAYNFSEVIEDPQYGLAFIMRDNKGKIQYIRSAKVSDKLNYNLITSNEYFNDLNDDIKLTHILFSVRFYFVYSIISYLIPLITAIVGHGEHPESYDNNLYKAAFVMYIIYAILGIWFKGCVHDIYYEGHTKRTCTKIMIYVCLGLKIIANSMISYRYCQGNKTGIVFVVMLIVIYFIHLNLNFIIYCCQSKYLLRTYWLAFLFYQISRLCIIIFFLITIITKVSHVETYIYAAILCVVLMYMYLANYFNTLMRDIVYNSYIQAVFNYPFEWMNLFCCWWKEPKECIKELDLRFCLCDSFFLAAAQVLGMIILVVIAIFVYTYLCFCAILLSGNKKNNNDD